LSSLQPGNSLNEAALKVAPDVLPGVAGAAVSAGAGAAEGAGFTAGAVTGAAGGVGVVGGGAAHAVKSKPTAHNCSFNSIEWSFRRQSFMIKRSITSRFFMDLLWFLLEAGLALSLLLGIVWWTWPRQARKDKGASTREK